MTNQQRQLKIHVEKVFPYNIVGWEFDCRIPKFYSHGFWHKVTYYIFTNSKTGLSYFMFHINVC